jgi:hypothetical protein
MAFKSSSQHSNRRTRRILRLAFVLAVVLTFVGICALVAGITVSEGERTGTITKFSHKGLVWTTWEGEMSLGGFRNAEKGHVEANVWSFTVESDEAVKAIQEAQRKGGVHTLRYRQTLLPRPWMGDTTYFVTGIVPQAN